MKEFFKKIGKVAAAIARPVVKEPVFFFVTIALLAQPNIEWLCYNDPLWYQIKFFIKALLMNFGVSYLATLIVYLTGKRWVKLLLYAFNIGLMSIMVFLKLNFDMTISPQTILVTMETNPSESSEFVTAYALGVKSLMSYAIVIGVTALVVLLELFGRPIARFFRRGLNRTFFNITASLFVVAGVVLVALSYTTLFMCHDQQDVDEWDECNPYLSLDLFSTTVYSVNSLRTSHNEIESAINQAVLLSQATTKPTVTEPDSLNVIYVLGESYIRDHASLYGYPLKTTPYMDAERQRGNLFAFTDAVAPANATSIVMRNTFSCNSIGDGERWYNFPCFTTIFKQAGYNVYMWDNQRDFFQHKIFTITVNSFLYSDEMAKHSYTQTNAKCYGADERIVQDFADTVKTVGKHNLIFFHLMGQHVDPNQRYPKSWERFTGDSITWRTEKWMTKEKRQNIAEYDNATLYNDYVLRLIFDLYRDKNTVVVYFGDHGDEMYDYRDGKGRVGTGEHPRPAMLKCENLIPFVIWCSDTFKQRHPDVVKRISEAVDRPFMTDNVCQLLFDLGGVNTSYYKPERNIISPNYTTRPRIVYGKFDYDAIVHPERKAK